MTVRTGVVEVVEETPRLEPEGGLGALRTERGNLPLEAVEVRTTVVGLTARTELAQTFRNPYDEPLEATYIFPLPDRAAVTRLRMEASGRVVEGVVKERETARADYDQAIAEGRRASIAEEERPGVFTLRVGNIVPGEQVVVRTTLSGRLPYEDGQATFRFPLVVAPRYIPGAALPGEAVGDGTAPDTDRVPDASRISPPVLLPGFPNPVRLAIEVAVDPAGLPLGTLTSSLHGVTVAERDGRHVVRLDPGARCDRDFVLRLGYGGEAAATSLVVARDGVAAEADEKPGTVTASEGTETVATDQTPERAQTAGVADTATGTFLLTVLPPEPTDAVRPRDVVLVLDRSGSMGGWKMAAARRAAARIVDTLTAADRFAVLTFDHEVTTPPDLPENALSAATDRHRFRAVQHLAAIEARGGTEMARPLRRAAELLTASDAPDADGAERDRVLVLVTDGQVGDEDALLSGLSGSLARLRVHTVGIDSAVNAGFLNRLAAAGGGRCELVESEDRLDEAMDAVHRRIGTPLVTGLRLTGGDGLGLDPDSITPSRLPDLFAGAPLVVAGRFTDADGRLPGDGAPGSVTVSGTAADGSSWTRHVAAVASEATDTSDDADLASFWARGRIRDLEDRYVSSFSGQDELERVIVDTSVRFNVLSRFTAFVAVDTVVVNESGEVKRVTQPVDLPAGWEPERDVAVPVSMPMFGAPPPAPAAAAAPLMAKRSRAAADRFSGFDGSSMEPEVRSTRGVRPVAPGSVGGAMTPPDQQIDYAMAASPRAEQRRQAEPAWVQLTDDERDAFAVAWLARLDAASAADADEQEKLLGELDAELRQLGTRLGGVFLPDLNAVLRTLGNGGAGADGRADLATRLEAAATFLKSIRKPTVRPRPFWKR
ncbi:MAG: VWA domain-containing protein [Catenulispora sp.]|nr:VWA domain-containing protein [Catenulispora sp.]